MSEENKAPVVDIYGVRYGRVHVKAENITDLENLRKVLCVPAELGTDYFMEVGALKRLAEAFGENAQ